MKRDDNEFDEDAFDESDGKDEWYTPGKRDTWAAASTEKALSLDEVSTALVIAGRTRLVVDLADDHPGKDSNLVMKRPDLLPADIRHKVSEILAHLDNWSDRVNVLRALGIAWKWVPRRGRPPKRSDECLGLKACGTRSAYVAGRCGGDACRAASRAYGAERRQSDAYKAYQRDYQAAYKAEHPRSGGG